MKLTTTLNLIDEHEPCYRDPDNPSHSGWNRLIDHLGHDYDRDAEINLLTILESNGVADCLWSLRATIQDSREIAVRLAIEFAERVLPLFEAEYPDDDRPRKTLEAAKACLENPTEENRRKADNAAEAARSASYAARSAVAAAEAARSASYAAEAARSASYAAEVVAAEAEAAEAAYAGYAAAAVGAAEAAYAAAYAAECEKQAEIIRKHLEGKI